MTCDACVQIFIWNPDAFNQITDKPEQDDDGPQHKKRTGRPAGRRARVAVRKKPRILL